MSARRILVTGGSGFSEPEQGCFRVAKKELAGVVRACLDGRRVTFAKGKLRDVLLKELRTFKVKITAAGNETFESWRESDHDDLVLAVALSLWMGERGGFGEGIETSPDATAVTGRIPRGVFLGSGEPGRKDAEGRRVENPGGIPQW